MDFQTPGDGPGLDFEAQADYWPGCPVPRCEVWAGMAAWGVMNPIP